jgi:hypothetical protein
MRKRKNDESRSISDQMGAAALKIGLVTLAVMTLCGATWLLSGPRVDESAYRLLYNPPTRVYPTPYLGPTSAIIPSRATLPEAEARFVFGLVNGDILISSGGSAPRDTGLHGDSPTLAPDGHTLAYVRAKQLIVYRDGSEKMVGVPGEAMMPAWSTDGESLAFVARETGSDTVYRLNLKTMQPSRLLSVSEIAAPPLFNPATGRLLIAEHTATRQTAFYTIDPDCAGGCKATRKDIATVDQTVNWASYHPSATRIAYSDLYEGKLYLLNTANGDVTALVIDDQYKRRPVFSKDGAWLAYVTGSGDLYALHLEDMVASLVSVSNVASVDWAQ